MDQDDAPSDRTGLRHGNVTATASASDGHASAHVRVQILLHGTGPAEKPLRTTGVLPDADTQPAAAVRPPTARVRRGIAPATVVAAVLVAAAFAAGALIF